MLNAEGHITMWIGSNTDIEDLKRAEAEREKLLHELQRERRRLEDSQEQLQDKFRISNSSHDVVVGRELKLIEAERDLEKLRQEVTRLTSLAKGAG